MCHDDHSRPPAPPRIASIHSGERLRLQSRDGNSFMAYAVQPEITTGRGVVILPDIRGLHAYYCDLADRFAEAGFSAIAIALLGRNGAVGMAFASLLFSFLEVASRALDLIDIAPETYFLMQGSILLSSVIAFEVVSRYRVKIVSEDLAKAVANA